MLWAGLGAQVCSELESDKSLGKDGVVVFIFVNPNSRARASRHIYILPDIKMLH